MFAIPGIKKMFSELQMKVVGLKERGYDEETINEVIKLIEEQVTKEMNTFR